MKLYNILCCIVLICENYVNFRPKDCRFSPWIEHCVTHWFSILSSDPKDATQVEEKPVAPTPGRLVAEPYSWKSLVTGQPILRICTTGTKASVLVLPPGRHVLRFLLQAPHGYHVEMASQTPFVYGDEDTVMVCLTKVITTTSNMQSQCMHAFMEQLAQA